MSMEVVEEVMGSSNDHVHIVKGKRTKRQRPSSPLAAAALDNMMTTSNSSSGEGGGYDAGGSGGGGGAAAAAAAAGDGHSYQSPTNSAELGDSTEEEEDMANCLILLAQGHSLDNSKQIEGGLTEKFISRRFSSEAPMATTTSNKAGFYLYQCKTCSRCFPSFQALGGHRASHKKPKAAATLPAGEKKTLMLLEDEHNLFMNRSSSNNHHHHHHSLNLQMGNRASGYSTSTTSNNKSKVHECSICGTEFSSGQALGGHMRRHRSSTTAAASMTTNTASMETLMMTESQDAKKQRTVLSLDLNLPAPEEERDSKFQFASKQQPLVFSASSLVDCHY